MSKILIIGAGLSGLSAARRLMGGGHEVLVVDKGAGIGGRMATRRFAGGVFDHGAQFFTVRSPELSAELAQWQAKNVAAHYFDGFPTPDNRKPNDHYPRYRGANGMTSIGKHLASGVDVRLSTEVAALSFSGGVWTAKTAAGEAFEADKLLLTAPAPQALALFDTSGASLPADVRATLAALTYEPCFALLAQLDGPSALPAPGLLFVEGAVIYWIADNSQKGISPVAGSVTIHSSSAFAKAHYDSDDTAVTALLLEAAAVYLGSAPATTQLRRWRYSKPENPAQIGALYAPELGVAFAGDALNGAKVEGAYLSGLEAARLMTTDTGG